MPAPNPGYGHPGPTVYGEGRPRYAPAPPSTRAGLPRRYNSSRDS